MAKKLTNGKKIIIVVVVAVLLLLAVFLSLDLSVSIKYHKMYSEDQHIARVEERVGKRYMTDEYEYTDYKVYPLYNEKDDLAYFLVEFEPYGFAYIKLNTRESKILGLFGIANMYIRDNEIEAWRRYRYLSGAGVYENGEWKENNKYPEDGWRFDANVCEVNGDAKNFCYETDAEGEFIEYNKSHYYAANITEEKRYLLEVNDPLNGDFYIPAVKRGDKYLNLISMQEFEYMKEGKIEQTPCVQLVFFIKMHEL